MYKDFNEVILRKNFIKYLKNGERENMYFGISDEVSKIAKKVIESDALKEDIDVLRNQLNFLSSGDYNSENVANVDEVNRANQEIIELNKKLDSLTFKKENLNSIYNNYLAKLDIDNAVKLKKVLQEIQIKIDGLNESKEKFKQVLVSDSNLYEEQIQAIRDNYDNVDLFKCDISGDYSQSVISDYKKERASKLVSQFLDSLTDEKREEVLNLNEDLKGYLNVGEDI